jgi:hypothetical protein
MVSRPIQIKYSVTNATVPTLIPGELAFTQAGNNFFIGAPDGSSGNIRIGHKLHDGVLTANEALVANSTGGIDRLIVGEAKFYSINTNSITTNSIFTGSISVNQMSTSNVSISKIVANSSTGTAGYVLTSAGPEGNVYWSEIIQGVVEAPYYYTTQMYDYRSYGLGWMNLAPNQNAETLGFRNDVTIPYGAVWILAINDGLDDPTPISIYSPHTRTTPMLWMTIDGSGPYDPNTNPNGQDYWFNITPPPSGA